MWAILSNKDKWVCECGLEGNEGCEGLEARGHGANWLSAMSPVPTTLSLHAHREWHRSFTDAAGDSRDMAAETNE